MKACAVGFLLFFLGIQGFAQTITILDRSSLAPVSEATAFFSPSERFFVTDSDGQFKVNSIGSDVEISISHSSFQSIKIKIDQLQKNEWNIILTEKVIQIDEVVVSATKWKQERDFVPHKVLKVNAKDIHYSNPQTSADMLGKTGQVFIQKSQLGGGSPMLRGFGASSVLITLDGIRINNAIYRSGNLQNVITIDPTMLASSEVLFGPGSTLYGSDALGGVLSFQTLEPYYPNTEAVDAKGSVLIRYASANHENTFGLNLQIGNKRFSNSTSISFSQFSDLRSGSKRPSGHAEFGKRDEYIVRFNNADQIVENKDVNLQRFSAYKQFNAMNKITYRMGNKSEFSHLLYFTNSSDIPRYDRLTQRDEEGVLQHAQWYYGPQFLLLNAFSFSSFSSNVLFDQAKLTLSNQMVDESRHDRKYQEDTLRSRWENVDVYALNMDFEKGLSSSASLLYGGEYFINDVTSTAQGENIMSGQIHSIASRYPNGGSSYASGAVYASLTYEPIEKIVLDAGARYTHIKLKETFFGNDFYELPFSEINQSNDALSGKVGMVFRPNSSFRWNLLFSSGFRAPNVDDMGKVFDSGDVVVVPNQDLKPEYTMNYETGFDWKVGDLVHLFATAYYSDLKDAMVRRPFAIDGDSTIVYDGAEFPMAALTNVGEAHIWGYSVGLDFRITEQWGLVARVNDSFGKDEIDDVPLRHTHPFFGKLSAKYETSKWKAELWSDFQGKRELDELAPSELDKLYIYSSEGALPWWTLNLRGAYYFNEYISITAAVENILDKHYRPYSSGISAPGINGVLSARYQF